MLRLVSAGGLVLLLLLCFALSKDRRAVRPRLILGGLLLQLAIGAVFLSWPAGNGFLQGLSAVVVSVLERAMAGVRFVFGALASPEGAEGVPGPGFVLATQALPLLIFFSALMAVLYHLGLMQRVVRGMAVVTARVLGTSGAESLAACSNVFVGPLEAPLTIRPYVLGMTMSELHALMTGGFATIAGTMFAVYVAFGIDPGHLIVASFMAAPASLLFSKLLWPETEVSQTMGVVQLQVERQDSSVVEAAARGAGEGLKLALGIAAMLIAFLGLVAVLDLILEWIGSWIGDEQLSLGRILGWLFLPIAAVTGVPWDDVGLLADLLGTKLTVTELVSFRQLGAIEGLDPRTLCIASFALCGFASLGTVAVQVGGLGSLVPERRTDVARLAFRTLFAGAIASCSNACVAGILI